MGEAGDDLCIVTASPTSSLSLALAPVSGIVVMRSFCWHAEQQKGL